MTRSFALTIQHAKTLALLTFFIGTAGLVFLHVRFKMPAVAFGAVHSLMFHFSILLLSLGAITLMGLMFNWSKQYFIQAVLLLSTVIFCLAASEIFLHM